MAVAVAATAAVVLPWTIRNAVVLNAFVPLTTNSGVNFYVGHNEHFGYTSANKSQIRATTDLNEVEESKHFLNLGLHYVREHPMQDLMNSFVKLNHVFTTRHKPFPWSYGREFSSRFPTIGWNYALLIISLFGVCLCALRSRAFTALIASTIVLHTATCMLFFGRTRFRVPLEPLFIMSAVFGLALLLTLIEQGVRTRQIQRTR